MAFLVATEVQPALRWGLGGVWQEQEGRQNAISAPPWRGLGRWRPEDRISRECSPQVGKEIRTFCIITYVHIYTCICAPTLFLI